MKTVYNFHEVNGLLPIGLPSITITAKDKSFSIEVKPRDIITYDTDKNYIGLSTKRFFFISPVEKKQDEDTVLDITVTQQFGSEGMANDNVLLEKTYHDYVLDGYTSFISESDKTTRYGYQFFSTHVAYDK